MPRHLLALVLIGFAAATHGQQATTAAGHNATGAGGSASYSVGQVVYTTLQGAGGTSSQGVQQPVEYLVLAVDVAPEQGGVSLAPNPTSDGVQLVVDGTLDGAQRYVLVDAAGQVVRTATINAGSLHIPMGDLPSATYLLRIEGTTPRTFRIIKQ